MEQELKREIEAIRGALLATNPFFGSLLLKCNFVAKDDLKFPAANDGRKTIYINSQFFLGFSSQDRLFILAHEALHLALLSAARRGTRDALLWNIATDCVINYLLLSSNILPTPQLRELIITPKSIEKLTNVDADVIEKMAAEQIYNLLCGTLDPNACDLPSPACCSHDEYAHHSGETDEGEGEDLKDYWAKAIAEAVAYAKVVGRTTPAGAEVRFEFIQPKVNWRALLRQAILQGPGLQVISTWKRLHRKLPADLPGYLRLTVPNTWILIDASGSMVGDSLDQVMSETLSIARSLNSKIRTISWDADAYEVTWSEIKSKQKVRGGGDTVIMPALRLLLSKIRKNDIVVVLTDGLISDINSTETRKLLEEAAAKASSAVFASTVTLPNLPQRWRKVLIA